MLKPIIKIGSFRALGFCLAITAFELLTYLASDMIMPAMLTVTDDLNASTRHIPSAFNLYLLGGVLLQWLIGPLADCFGRRKVLLVGCAVFAMTCVMTLWVQSIFAFNLLRLLQGMGLGFVIAVSYLSICAAARCPAERKVAPASRQTPAPAETTGGAEDRAPSGATPAAADALDRKSVV